MAPGGSGRWHRNDFVGVPPTRERVEMMSIAPGVVLGVGEFVEHAAPIVQLVGQTQLNQTVLLLLHGWTPP